MFVGRERERGKIDALLEAARGGLSGVLVLRGEPGIGKTALLDYARGHADDFLILSAEGVEVERELPFAALSELLRPALPSLERLPPPQAAALAAAFALGPPAPGDPFTVSAATLNLLALAAEGRPLLATIDDAQWVDAASLRTIVFAARRLGAEGIVILLAARVDRLGALHSTHLPELEIEGLDRDTAAHLLSVRFEAAPRVREMILDTSAGNPLALSEIPALLTDDQLAGREPLPDPLPIGRTLGDVFGRRLAALPPETRSALLVAAAEPTASLDVLSEAFARLGVDVAALEPAEEADLVSIDRAIRFTHPLARAAVYGAAPPSSRRRAHRALADAFIGDHSRRGWHLAYATLGPDEEAAAELEAVALDARQRGATVAAAAAQERAAHLTPDSRMRASRLLLAARDWQPAGSLDRADALLGEAFELAPDEKLRAEIQQLRARSVLYRGSPREALAMLELAADEAEAHDPAHAAALLIEAALAAQASADVDAAIRTAERACRLAENAPEARPRAKLTLAQSLILRGESERAETLLNEVGAVAARADPLHGFHVLQVEAGFRMIVGDLGAARAIVERIVAIGRTTSAPGLLSFPLATLALIDFESGRWVAAYAEADESVRLAEETAQVNFASYALLGLARIQAGRGDAESCRAYAERGMAIGQSLGIDSLALYGGSALALLELGLGKPEQAIEYGEPIARMARERGIREPAVVKWAPDLIEAYVRARRLREAAAELEEFETLARASGRIWALATAARCRGLLSHEAYFDEAFEVALRLHETSAMPFETARTQLCLGERRRRAGRRVDARKPLRSALATFERLGALSWAKRTRAELQATGEAVRERTPFATDKLTAHELQVALLVARGDTNREAAAELFLSPKTIEFHLGHVYRKLGVRSRTELARVFAEDGG